MVVAGEVVRNRILDAAVHAIDVGGEASLRVVAVCEAAGVTQGMVRYYFGNRDGLVSEAKGVRFGRRFGEFLDEFESAAAGCQTPDQLRAVIDAVFGRVFIRERSVLRLERNVDVGGAVGHAALAERIAASRDEGCLHLARILGSARDRNLIRKDADVVAVSAMYYVFVHGFSLWELGKETIDRESIVAVFKSALFAALFD
ncbi:MAG: hypothetical protein RJB08_1442 [Actinomycetota bacterium]|jgi:AcrR family transcriptional regulator